MEKRNPGAIAEIREMKFIKEAAQLVVLVVWNMTCGNDVISLRSRGEVVLPKLMLLARSYPTFRDSDVHRCLSGKFCFPIAHEFGSRLQ